MHFEKVSGSVFYADSWYSDNPYICDDILRELKLPQRATVGSAGYDFFAPVKLVIPPHSNITIATGIRWVCDDDDCGRVLMIYPRSGLGFKYGIRLANSVGIIDEDFYTSDNGGHIMIKLYNPSDKEVVVEKGKGFAQGVIVRYLKCDNEEDVTNVRNGGFGSTTKAS